MKLDQQPELLADAVRATSEYYHITPVYIEKDYWISKILQQLSLSIYADSTVFKGGTSLSKGYGLINRFSEDVDVAILTGKLSGNQIKALISYDLYPFELNILDKRRTLCEKVVSLLRFSFMNNPVEGLSSKIRYFYDIYFLLNDAECMEYLKGNFVEDVQKLIEHDKEAFDVPEKWKNCSIGEAPLLNSFDELWGKLSGLYERELNALAYSQIPEAGIIEGKITAFLSMMKSNLR